MKKKSGVYLIRCEANGKVYVGSSVDIKQRWSKHRRDLRAGKHHTIRLQRAWNKYGEDAFTWHIIVRCDSEHCIENEQREIDSYKAADREFGFNNCEKAGSCRGRRHTEEARARMSISQSNRTPETCATIAAIHRGMTHSAESRKRISDSKRGTKYRPRSPEHCAKISAAATARWEIWRSQRASTTINNSQGAG